MKNEEFILIAGLSILCITNFVSAANAAKPPRHVQNRPNILLFITDDESWRERSAYGWSTIPTPHFDHVAENGILFMNGYTSAPSCTPSRASLLTGRHFWELKQGAFIQAYLPKEFPLFTHELSANGYWVGSTYKVWGPGVKNQDSHKSFTTGNYNVAEVKSPAPGITHNDYAANFDLFLKDREPEQPFFFWAGIFEPHSPYGPENYKRLEKEFGISLDEISMPPQVKDTLENRKERGNTLYEICYADLHLGRMLKSLEAIGELDNTLVIATSDNGIHVYEEGRVYGKISLYDYGVHVPLAMMWPHRIKAGRTVTDFVNFADLAPTFLELAGIVPSYKMTGRSIVPLLDSKKSGRIDPKRNVMTTGLEWHGELDPVSRSGRQFRDDHFAYIIHYNNLDAKGRTLSNEAACKPANVEFYDLKNDPWQLKDLSNDPTYADQIKSYAEKFREYGLKTGDPRVTGDMDIFQKTRRYVLKRKIDGYSNTQQLSFDAVE